MLPRFKHAIFFIGFSILAFGCNGCNLSGIHYEFISWDQYQAGEVLDKPEDIKGFTGAAENLNRPGLEFFAVGCAGAGNEGQMKVAESMALTAAEHPAAFTLYLGDNFYARGVSSVDDPQWQSKFENVYKQESLQIPFYAVLGNHDYYKNPAAQIAYSGESRRWRMPGAYYTFEQVLEDGTRIEFFALDTVALVMGDEAQLEWLEEKLKNSKADWKIAYGHHPVYSGANTWVEEKEKLKTPLESLFNQYGVDVYLSAHNHSIEIFEDISGVTYVVSGAGSRPRDVRWTDKTDFAHADLGFTWFRVTRDKVNIYAVGREGQVLHQSEVLRENENPEKG